MKLLRSLLLVSVTALLLVPTLLFSRSNARAKTQPRTRAEKPIAARLGVASDLRLRLAKWRVVNMPFNAAGLSARDRQMVEKLVDACRYLDDIYWRQNDPEALTLYEELKASSHPMDARVRRMLKINGSRFDLLDENKPFIGTQSMPPGRGFYPQGLTREQVEQYVRQHPDSKAEIYSPYTVVRWQGNDLVGLPYRIAY